MFGFWLCVTKIFFGNSINKLAKLIELVYIVFLFFLNNVLMNFVIDLYIMFIEKHQFLLLSGQLLRRASKTGAYRIGVVGLVNFSISVLSARVTKMNESQICFD